MPENEKKLYKDIHICHLDARRHMEITGVTDVPGFDEETVTLVTADGNMEVTGSELHIKVLDLDGGIVTLDGHIDGISYYTVGNEEKRGFFSGLFHR